MGRPHGTVRPADLVYLPQASAGGCRCRRHRHPIWLQLASHLDRIRNPVAIAGWLATTTRRECVKARHQAHRSQAIRHVLDAETIPDEQAGMAEQELLLAERHAALREAFPHLPPGRQRLIAMLVEDPPVPYAQISTTLGIPVGSIGPSRGRCLDKLRRDPAIAALIDTKAASVGGELPGQAAALG